jgi:hypothetical protein
MSFMDIVGGVKKSASKKKKIKKKLSPNKNKIRNDERAERFNKYNENNTSNGEIEAYNELYDEIVEEFKKIFNNLNSTYIKVYFTARSVEQKPKDKINLTGQIMYLKQKVNVLKTLRMLNSRIKNKLMNIYFPWSNITTISKNKNNYEELLTARKNLIENAFQEAVHDKKEMLENYPNDRKINYDNFYNNLKSSEKTLRNKQKQKQNYDKNFPILDVSKNNNRRTSKKKRKIPKTNQLETSKNESSFLTSNNESSDNTMGGMKKKSTKKKKKKKFTKKKNKS